MRGVRCGVKVRRTLCECSYIRKCAQMLIKQRMQWTKLKRQHSEHPDSTSGSLSSVSPFTFGNAQSPSTYRRHAGKR
jgi:hypothetical protein